jgi:hypothetical protein
MKAFPQKYPINANYSHHSEHNPVERGMELRDYFAAKAMQAIITNSDRFSNHIEEIDKWVGNYAYTVADAMMEARNDNK